MVIDLSSPLTSWSISIGCIAAPIEILPTTALHRTAGRAHRQTLLKSAASAGDAEQLCLGIVIVLVSFDVEKREARFAVAHSKIKRLHPTEVFRLPAG